MPIQKYLGKHNDSEQFSVSNLEDFNKTTLMYNRFTEKIFEILNLTLITFDLPKHRKDIIDELDIFF